MRCAIAAVAAGVSMLCLAGSGMGRRGPEDPRSLAADYLRHLESGHPYLAVDECYDAEAFARRVFGKEFDALKPGEGAYVAQLASVMLKAAVTTVPMDKHLKKAKRSEFVVAGEGDEVRVRFTLTGGEGAGGAGGAGAGGVSHETTLVLSRASGSWRIVDVEPLAATFAKEYPKVKMAGGTAVQFMESAAVSMIEGKNRGPSQVRRDAKSGLIATQLDTLSNQIELFKARTGRYPNLAKGWQDLLNGGYIKKPPVNPVNGRSEVAVGGPRANCGWNWDPGTGTLSACYFDEETGVVTPGVP